MASPTSPSANEQTSPILNNGGDNGAGGEDGNGNITIRALISTKEAGIIIGQQGKTVATIRNDNNVKAGVSKVVSGVQDRVLSVTGSVDNISKVSDNY